MNQWELLINLLLNRSSLDRNVEAWNVSRDSANVTLVFPLRIASYNHAIALFPDGTWKVVNRT